MATIYIYDNNANTMQTYSRGETESMPYNTGGSLTVAEFRGSSKSTLLWTDRHTMEAWNRFRSYYGRPIFVGFAFKRIWEGGHGTMSQHYAGTSFDAGQNLSREGRNVLRNAAYTSGLWSYVEPASLTPTWVHFDKRFGTPACASGGYPVLRQGSRGIYVLVMQDALAAVGYSGGGLDGIFGTGTRSALTRFQSDNGLTADGIAGCHTLSTLCRKATGIGRTPNVLKP